MTIVVATPITATPNGLSMMLMFAFLNVDRHGTASALFKLYHRIYIYIYLPQDIYVDI